MNYDCGSYVHAQLEFASHLKVLEPSRNTAIYVQPEFASRLKTLETSWNTANDEGP